MIDVSFTSIDDFIHRSIGWGGDVNQWLETMGYALEWDVLKGGMAQLILKDKSGIKINLKNIGFGISQLLPVLIQGCAAEETQTILMG